MQCPEKEQKKLMRMLKVKTSKVDTNIGVTNWKKIIIAKQILVKQ